MAKKKAAVNGHDNERGENGEGRGGECVDCVQVCACMYVGGWVCRC